MTPDDDNPYDAKQPYNADEEALAALGYKSEFKREFSLYATCAVSFAILGLLPSFASTLFFSMGYAGTAGMAWGWPIAMIGIQCVALSMAELCSSMPTSGGMYYAAAVLAPPAWAPFASWVTCWSNWLVQITGAPSGTFFFQPAYFEVLGISRVLTMWAFSELRHLIHDSGSGEYYQSVLQTKQPPHFSARILYHDYPRRHLLDADAVARTIQLCRFDFQLPRRRRCPHYDSCRH